MAPHDERIAAFGKRLPEELEDGRDRSLRNQCGRQVGDRAADESLVVIGRRTRIEFDFGRMVVAAAGSLQRLAGTRGIGTVLAVVAADMRRHRDALARKRHIRRAAPRRQVDGEQQQRYESFQFHATFQVFRPCAGHVPPVTPARRIRRASQPRPRHRAVRWLRPRRNAPTTGRLHPRW